MRRRIDFSTYASIKIGPSVDLWVIEDAQATLPEPTCVIGGANNLLISPTPPPLAILGKGFDFIYLEEDILHIGAATPSGKILSFAKKHDLSGFEMMQKLPGTLGGMLSMNAGLKEWEIFEHVIAIRTQNGWIPKAQIPHGYRFAQIEGVIYEATFTCKKGFDLALVELFKQMRANQPPEPSCGSCFKNPPGEYAGRLIEAVGYKGKGIGGVFFSPQHANFLINRGGGSFEEAITLITEVKEAVKARYGITLEEEIKIL